jgi:hypothetical protein
MKNHYELKLSRWRKIFSLSVVFVLLFIVSCKKNNTQIVMDNNLSTEDAKLIYDAQYRAENIGNNENNLEPLWDKPMELTRLDTGIALKFPISQSSNPYFLSTIVFKKNLAGSYDVKMKEIKVDSNYYNRFKNNEINNLMNRVDFSGKVYTKTLANRIENIQAYANGNLLYESTIITIKNIEETGQLGGKGKMMSVANGSGSSQQIVNYSIQLRSVPMHMLICTRSVSFTIYPGVSPMYAEVLSKVKQTCSTTQATNSPDVAYQIFIDLRGIAQNLVAQNASSGGEGLGGTGAGDDDGSNGSTSFNPSQSDFENATLIEDGEKKITNIDKYIDCFNDGKAVSEYKLTFFVDQPIAGTNKQTNIIALTGTIAPGNLTLVMAGSSFDVGHAFVAFEKINTDGSTVRQVLGFYPDSFGPYSDGVVKDNSGHAYDVSLSRSVTSVEFISALAQVKNDFNNKNYNVLNYNCTDAALYWMNAAGANLADKSRGVFKNTPGDYGQELRNISTANKNGGIAPQSKGPCN